MKSVKHRERRKALYGWLLWLPVTVLPFSVLFADVWLNLETRRDDYELFRLQERSRQLSSELDLMRVEEARLEALNRLVDKAPELGLVNPEPDQFIVLYHEPSETSIWPEDTMILARHDEPRSAVMLDAPSGSAVLEDTVPVEERAEQDTGIVDEVSAAGESAVLEEAAAVAEAAAPEHAPEEEAPAVEAISEPVAEALSSDGGETIPLSEIAEASAEAVEAVEPIAPIAPVELEIPDIPMEKDSSGEAIAEMLTPI